MEKVTVCGGIIEKDGKYLLIQEAKKKAYGKWNIPAGRLEDSELIFDGAKREIKEESGFDVDLTGILLIENKIYDTFSLIGFVFATKIINEPTVYSTEDSLDIKWFTYEEILSMEKELRDYQLVIESIKALKNNKVVDINLIKI